MVTKKIRTEYMKKFRDPRWETFSKCYEDSVKYRLTRRVIEHSHKPWFWEGWDGGSDSSGWSTPRLSRNKVVPLSVAPPPPPPPPSEGKHKLSPSPEAKPASDPGETQAETNGASDAAAPSEGAVVENGASEGGSSPPVAPNASRPSEDTATDNGPVDSTSSDGEPANPVRKRRQRRRTPRSEPAHPSSSHDNNPPAVRKPSRAKSQPPSSTKEENRWSSCRLDWTEKLMEMKRTRNDSHTTDAGVQTQRQHDKRGSNLERRRARSADLEKTRSSQLTAVDDHWMTEYMRCFSARLR